MKPIKQIFETEYRTCEFLPASNKKYVEEEIKAHKDYEQKEGKLEESGAYLLKRDAPHPLLAEKIKIEDITKQLSELFPAFQKVMVISGYLSEVQDDTHAFGDDLFTLLIQEKEGLLSHIWLTILKKEENDQKLLTKFWHDFPLPLILIDWKRGKILTQTSELEDYLKLFPEKPQI